AFVTYVAETSLGVPLVIVATARPDLYDRAPNWAGGLRNATTITLGLLSPIETGQMVSALLDESLLSAAVQSQLVERTGGNPLYLEQFIHLLTERALLVRDGRGWKLAGDREMPTPDGIRAMVAARLDS